MNRIGSNIPLINGSLSALHLDIFDPKQFALASGTTLLNWFETRYPYGKDVALPANGAVLGQNTLVNLATGTTPYALVSHVRPIYDLAEKAFGMNTEITITETGGTPYASATSVIAALRVKLIGTSLSPSQFCGAASSNYYGAFFLQGVNALTLYPYTNGSVTSVAWSSLNNNKYMNIIITFRATTGVLKVYINGSLTNTINAFSGTFPASGWTAGANWLNSGVSGAGTFFKMHMVGKNGNPTDEQVRKLNNYMNTI